MNSPESTIVALATAPIRSALGIIRLSGGEVLKIISGLTRKKLPKIKKLTPRQLNLLTLYHPKTAEPIDEVMLALFSCPHSYTGEDMAEIYFHGNPVIASRIIESAIRLGARAAYGGEFTYRAIQHAKMDLNQAEAVHNLIAAPTASTLAAILKTLGGNFSPGIRRIIARLKKMYGQVEARLNYPEDDIDIPSEISWGKNLNELVREILALERRARYGRQQMVVPTILIVGKQNVGKSSLFNRLMAEEAALVSPEPGTTRDVIPRLWQWQNFSLIIGDTAGLFPETATSEIDLRAIELTRQKMNRSVGLIFVLDASRPLTAEEIRFLRRNRKPTILAINKIDLPAAWGKNRLDKIVAPGKFSSRRITLTSARENIGIDKLCRQIVRYFGRHAKSANGEQLLIGERAYQSLKNAAEKIRQLRRKITGHNLEIISFYLNDILNELEIVAGKTTSEEIINNIFSRFCVGK